MASARILVVVEAVMPLVYPQGPAAKKRGLADRRRWGTIPGVKSRRPGFLSVSLMSALVLGLLLGLIWAMAFRENAARRLDLQFAAFRASTRLVEEFLQDPGTVKTGADILGLGIYDPSGAALFRMGRAPEDFVLEEPGPSSFSLLDSGASILLVRRLGFEEGMSSSMPMMGRGRAMGLPRRPGLGLGQGPGQGPGMGQVRARVLWLEYSSSAMSRANLLTLVASVLLSLGIASLYLTLIRLYRRNLELREREAGNRELIQLGEAARTLAHEIKNPLAVIRIQAASIRRLGEKGLLDTAGLGERTLVIEEEVDRLSSLSDRIREFLRSGEGEAVDLDLASFLADFASRYGPCLELGKVPGGLGVRIDPARLGQALDNVVRNALEASPGAGEAGQDGPPAARIEVAHRGKDVEICVEDEGSGVAPELEGRLFEPFFTTKDRGSGIGLALARRIAESAGGRLAYRRKSPRGSAFVFSFPLQPN
jgi:two-component system sensor histidine kinase HydH